MMYSPSDRFAWGLITEGSNQVSQSEILSISICYGWNSYPDIRPSDEPSRYGIAVRRMNNA